LLQRYHDQLPAHGVTGYTWDQMWTDYRLMIPMGVYIAVEYSRGGLNTKTEHVWKPFLQRTLTACDDLNCIRPLLNASLLRTTTGPNPPRRQRSPTPSDLNRRYPDT
jgi:hypothetical protein